MKYKMPAKANLRGRTSTISNAFAISITPYIVPEEEEIKNSYNLLGIKDGQCAYCLGEGTAKDHLKPLVRNGMPTGYITSVENLVPCCSACNSSKGSKEFKKWYMSEPNLERLRKKGLSDKAITERYSAVCNYEDKIGAPLDYESIVGADLWQQYKDRKQAFFNLISEDQEFCDMLNGIIMDYFEKQRKA